MRDRQADPGFEELVVFERLGLVLLLVPRLRSPSWRLVLVHFLVLGPDFLAPFSSAGSCSSKGPPLSLAALYSYLGLCLSRRARAPAGHGDRT